MKWNNRGYEFDKIAGYWSEIEGVFFYGDSSEAEKLYKMLTFVELVDKLDVKFVDSKFEKQKEDGEKIVISPAKMMEYIASGCKYIIVDCTIGNAIIPYLLKISEIQFNKNLFTSLGFQRTFLPVLLWYKYGKAFINTTGVLFSTRCNLNCKGCMVCTDRYSTQKDRPFELICKDIDTIFGKFDYVWDFGFSGAEPFFYPHTSKVMDYAKKYCDKMYMFSLTTNATIPLSDALVDSYRSFYAVSPWTEKGGGAHIYIDDYSENVKQSKAQQLYETACKNNIKTTMIQYKYWIDMGYDKVDYSELSEEALANYYDICDNPCSCIADGKFYSCSAVISAANAGMLPDEENNYIDVEKCSIPEFIEFRSGYSQKGYFEMCKHCAGHLAINRNEIKVAEQAPRKR